MLCTFVQENVIKLKIQRERIFLLGELFEFRRFSHLPFYNQQVYTC